MSESHTVTMASDKLTDDPTTRQQVGRFDVSTELHIFDILLQENARGTCAALTQLSKDHHARLSPRFWHTVILDDRSAKHFAAFIASEVRTHIKRIVFAEPPPDDDMTWVPEDEVFLGEACSLGFVSFEAPFPAIEQIVLTRSFTIAFAKYLSRAGYSNGNRHFPRLPKYAKLARDLVLESGPYHSLFWDLDFPFTLDSWLAHAPGATAAQYNRIRERGILSGILEAVFGADLFESDEAYVWGEQSQLRTVTLWNYHCLQRVPLTFYCDLLHVVVSPYALKPSHAVGYFGGRQLFFALERSLELVIEANVNKVLIQGLKGICDGELEQAASEIVICADRGGQRTVQRVIERVRFGGRRYADNIRQLLFNGGMGGDIDYTALETMTIPASLIPLGDADDDNDDDADVAECQRNEKSKIIANFGFDPFEDDENDAAPAAAQSETEPQEDQIDAGHMDNMGADIVKWFFKPHDYQLCPDFSEYHDPHMSFWQAQSDDPRPTDCDSDDSDY